MDDSWREFEKLVARIERALSPSEAIVKSPDRIRDLETDMMREVDASIRYKIGTTPILITIESRDRANVQDVTWIEQLATKKQKIGAASTIAVSSKGFSQAAATTALQHGIEIRVVSEIKKEDISQWMSIGEIQVFRTKWRVRRFEYEIHAPESTEEEITSKLAELRSDDGMKLPFFYRTQDSVLCSANDLINEAESNENCITRALPRDGAISQLVLRIEYPERFLEIHYDSQKWEVRLIIFHLDAFVDNVSGSQHENYFSYTDAKSELYHAAEATTHVDGHDFSAGLFRNASTGNIQVKLSVLNGHTGEVLIIEPNTIEENPVQEK